VTAEILWLNFWAEFLIGRSGMLRNLARIFRRDASAFKGAQQGATMVEFALIAPAFMALLVAVFETTMFLFAQSNLQAAANEAGRLFMTGQAQNSSMSASQFKSAVCPMVSSMFNCSSLIIIVANASSASSLNTSTPQMYNGGVVNPGSYQPGTPGDLMTVQIGYPLPVVAGPLGFFLNSNGNGTAAVWGTAAFRVEPYTSS
jgi:Flp pilus assembly protein TadG